VGALPTEIVVELQCVAYLDSVEAGAE